MKWTQMLLLSLVLGLTSAVTLAQTVGGGTCNSSSLNGTYAFTMNGRQVTNGTFAKVLQSVGTAVFDSQSKTTFTLTVNTNAAAGTPQTSSGTYTVQANCSGTLTGANGANFALVVYNSGKTFSLAGQDGTYAYAATGTVAPATCALSTLSGAYTINGNGFSLLGSTVTGVLDLAGLLQIDGQGNLTSIGTIVTNAGAVTSTATGTYTLNASCVGSATITDPSGGVTKTNFVVTNATGADFDLISANSSSVLSGNGHSAFVNPSQAVVNAASNLAAQTPAGSLFTIYGSGLAAKQGQAASVPLPTTLGTTSVTVNGELAPLFYADQNQINAQMPEDIKPGLATIIVKNGTAVSNAVAVTVPDAGTPGIFIYGNNRAVAVNADQFTVNSTAQPVKVGDIMTAYFTGGGPVKTSATLVTGTVSPASLAPVAGANSATVAGNDAPVSYMGLTPGSIGLYQVNFKVPKVANGDHPLAITIAGKISNRPLIAVVN